MARAAVEMLGRLSPWSWGSPAPASPPELPPADAHHLVPGTDSSRHTGCSVCHSCRVQVYCSDATGITGAARADCGGLPLQYQGIRQTAWCSTWGTSSNPGVGHAQYRTEWMQRVHISLSISPGPRYIIYPSIQQTQSQTLPNGLHSQQIQLKARHT